MVEAELRTPDPGRGKRCAIIGGGISGLSAAYFLQKQTSYQIDLYDSANRVGGVIHTEIVEDCVLDGGPDSFLTQKKSAVRLCEEVGLGNELIGSNDADRKTFIFYDSKLQQFPEGFFLMVPTRILPLVTTGLLSWAGKLSAVHDLFSYPEKRDISVADFIESRFGLEILNQIAEPLLSGVYGGDVRRLSLKSALPQLWQMQQKGSLMRQLFLARFRSSGEAAKEPLFTTLSRGMQMLPQALQEKCTNVRWHLGTRVDEIIFANGRWRIGAEEFDSVIVATSAVPRLLANNGERIRQLMGGIRKNSAIVVSLCFTNMTREGFGWLVPMTERHSVLAATYVNNKFARRCPPDKFLVRSFIGGNFAAEWIERSDDHIYKEVMRELNRIAGIQQQPLFYRIYRWKDAMPEYTVGHEERIREIEKLAAEQSGLYFTGNVFSGVGIPDCIAHAQRITQRLSGE